MRSKPILSIKHEVSGSKALEKALAEIKRTAIYVGIANDSEKNKRKDGAPITNAQLGFIHEFGSPAANIPARPFLVPGVESVKDKIGADLGKAAKAALKGDESGFDAQMKKTSIDAAEAVKSYMKGGDFAPLAPSTIKTRQKKIKAVGGVGASIKPLIDTADLLGSISGIVSKED